MSMRPSQTTAVGGSLQPPRSCRNKPKRRWHGTREQTQAQAQVDRQASALGQEEESTHQGTLLLRLQESAHS